MIDFAEVRNRVMLLDYCHSRGIRLRQVGHVWMGRCPIHQEENGRSFVVWGDQRWSCFGKCNRGGDVIDLERALGGGTVREAVERLGAGAISPVALPPNRQNKKGSRSSSWAWQKLLRDGTEAELGRLGRERNVSVESCRLAQARGLLRFLDTREGVAWVVTDQIIQNAVARLLGGHLWANDVKAKNLPGSRAKRPIGVIEAIRFPCVAIVEGGPDALAAFHFMLKCGTHDRVAPVCMASANARFLPGELQRLRGKSIRLFPHADQKGIQAALRWLDQLKILNTKVDVVDLRGPIKADGSDAKDLNDLTSLASGSREAFRNILAGLMRF